MDRGEGEDAALILPSLLGQQRGGVVGVDLRDQLSLLEVVYLGPPGVVLSLGVPHPGLRAILELDGEAGDPPVPLSAVPRRLSLFDRRVRGDHCDGPGYAAAAETSLKIFI